MSARQPAHSGKVVHRCGRREIGSKRRLPVPKRKLTPADFRKKLTIKELVAIRRQEQEESYKIAFPPRFFWGMRL